MSNPIRATFNDRPISADEGVTVGAALQANGIISWRNTRKNDRPRGLFCGIGVCFDCLVDVDDQRNERACMVLLREGMHIKGVTPADAEGEERA